MGAIHPAVIFFVGAALIPFFGTKAFGLRTGLEGKAQRHTIGPVQYYIPSGGHGSPFWILGTFV